MKEHTCRDSNYWTQFPFKPCFQCMCQLSKNSAECFAKKGKKK